VTINFPSPATLNQIYSSPPQQWLYDGEKWTALNSQGSLSLYLPLTGGALSSPGNLSIAGTLSVTGNTTLQIATASTPATADNSTRIATTSYVQAQGYATAASVSAGYLKLTGGTLTGALGFSGAGISPISMNSYTWGFGWDNSCHLYVNGGDQGRILVGAVQGDGWWLLYNSASLRVYDFQSQNNINASGSLYCGGCQIYNSGGWTTTPQPFQSSSSIYGAGEVSAGNAVHVGGNNSGTYWQYNGGWMYTPNSVLVGGNINTHEIQMNGNNVDGMNVAYSNGTAYGGWGAQYNWTGNGNWTSFQLSDLLYTYNNQGFAGGVYWTYCDARMKWNFDAVTRDCLAAINAIELRSFDFSEGCPPQRRTNPHETRPALFRFENLPRKVKHFETGFVAQQLRELIPEAVPEPPVEGAFLSVDLRPVVATLIGAVQQLSVEVAALKARNSL